MEDGGFVDRALFEFSEDRPIDVGNSKSGGRRRTHRRINIDRAAASLQTIEVPGESRCRRLAGDQLAEGLVADVCAEGHRLFLDGDAGQNAIAAKTVAKRRGRFGRKTGLVQYTERFGALGAADVSANDSALSIGKNIGLLAAAVDMHGPSHLPAGRLGQDETASRDLHPRNGRWILQIRARDRVMN